ncbi:N-(5'-phosphoribosyl)anthranilate isomerase [Roseobacter sp. AzwK-3b]|jgi:phosphoribosylanthranilate isomerase|uniref:N-(5'-phosphoribosyl)anthranilate isomerase n=1 Tax=Roseovarius litoreus TaxID=1155722 RepID=A0A1M7HU19_9RHOB|nr:MULTISPECIES: phosphoribosylanthranilate isomerase [Roseobacteraceae]EDM69823.1 N-(5'-phosphoribosyl)anthranilate isomerase [Roseobacter sp. AzwK-3b]SHM31975.1 phosphoribosylanthranilate isomerase [Roseovarius litoreus]
MPDDIKVKICGLTDPADVPAAILAGASYVGFVFFPKSPRNLDLEAAAFMAAAVPEGIIRVALTVDPDDALLDALTAHVQIDMIQLHGHETPARVTQIKQRTGLPVMKAVGVADETDLTQIDFYEKVADQILVDAKPPAGADRPGGNAMAFDWTLLSGRRWSKPWMLAGGLNPDNVADAVHQTGARQLDVSSGVERAPGEKDADLMRAFIDRARAASED